MSPPAGATARFAAGRADPPQLILASASPRRRQILESVGLSFSAHAVDLDERPLDGEPPELLAVRLASSKAIAGATRFPEAVALGADTVVALDGITLGKPSSPDDAFQMLQRLRGRTHQVITAVATARIAPARKSPTQWARTSFAEVEMRDYSDNEIADYVASGDPLDKAGAYAIQHPNFRPVLRLTGCYLAVVGLALPEVFEVLADAGMELPPLSEADLKAACPNCSDRARLLLTP